MKAELVELDLDQVDSTGNLMGVGRSKGVHLSQVIRYAREKMDGPTRVTGNDNFITMGFLFEHLIEQAFKSFGQMMRSDRDRLVRPGEHLLDGIYGTPDAVDGRDGTLEEYKATYKSMGRLIGTNLQKDDCAGDVECWLKRFHWWWLVQIMAYCWMLGTQKARLIVLMVNGDYSHKAPYGGPQLLAIDLDFTMEDLAGNWANVLQYRDEMLQEAA